MKYLLSAILLSFFVGCATATIRPDGGPKNSAGAQYESSETFFIFGLVGEANIDVKDICGSKKVEQMQTQATFMNSFLGALTLGIYTPKTARVWCSND
jgi:hypothetical protein